MKKICDFAIVTLGLLAYLLKDLLDFILKRKALFCFLVLLWPVSILIFVSTDMIFLRPFLRQQLAWGMLFALSTMIIIMITSSLRHGYRQRKINASLKKICADKNFPKA